MSTTRALFDPGQYANVENFSPFLQKQSTTTSTFATAFVGVMRTRDIEPGYFSAIAPRVPYKSPAIRDTQP
jgi:hypothetical protein